MTLAEPNGGPVPAEEVRAQLDRILASPGFAGSARIRRFLQFVVDQQLAGEGAALKEYAIGVEVFDRPADYDPRLDSIVRVEAGRLRSKIDEYYANAGATDEIRIRQPRGSYVPVLERRSRGGSSAFARSASADRRSLGGGWLDPPSQDGPLPAPSHRSRRSTAIALGSAALLALVIVAGWRSLIRSEANASVPGVSIAVLPFEAFSGTEADLRLADQITDEVTTALARLGTLSVVSRTSARQFQGIRKPMHEIGDALGAQVVMEAAIEIEGERLLIQPRLVDATIDRKFWVGTYRGARSNLRELAAQIAAGATEAVRTRRAQK